MKVRQSTLGGADKCLRSMQYDLEHPVYHGGSVRAVGTAYHAGLELAYNNEIATGVWMDVRMAMIEARERFDASAAMVPSHESEKTKQAGEFRWDDEAPDTATAHAMIERMLQAYWDAPEAHWRAEDGWKVLGAEVGFSLPFWNGHTRNGSIDLVLQDPNGFICGEDHKTAKNQWGYNKHEARKQNQSPFYVAALQELYPGAPGYRFFYDIMTYKGVFDRRESKVKAAHVQAVTQKAIEVAALYEGMRSGGLDLPANPASNLCSSKYCDHWNICPYGASLDLQ